MNQVTLFTNPVDGSQVLDIPPVCFGRLDGVKIPATNIEVNFADCMAMVDAPFEKMGFYKPSPERVELVPVIASADVSGGMPRMNANGAVCFGRLPGRTRHALELRDAGVTGATFEAEMADYDLLQSAAAIAAANAEPIGAIDE